MKFTYVLFILSLILATALSQDSGESEETATPKKVLRKYRVRRPVTAEPVTVVSVVSSSSEVPKPRVRRIRVKQAKPVVIEATPQSLLSSRYASTSATTPANVVQEQTQQVYYDEQQVVDPIRVVPNYRQAIPSATRTALLAKVNLRDQDEDNKKEVVGTTRNYSHINEDGSFTFGYEGEDGSFKEETRGTDCVVRGKYGYVDPNGVRREFTYVSGNPCDPNDPNRGEVQDDEEDEEAIIQPARAGNRQRIPAVERKPTLINANVQQALEQTVEERVQEDQVFRPVLRRVRPQQPQAQTPQPDADQATTFRPRIRITPATPTPATGVPDGVFRAFPQFRQPAPQNPLPRPLAEPNQDLSDRGNRAFNFQQELQNIAGPIQFQQPSATQQPQVQYRQLAEPQQTQYNHEVHPIHRFPQRQHFGSLATSIFQQQQEARPPQQQQQQQPEAQQPGNYARYRTELVYDPASGQYTNVVVQETPKTNEEFTLTQRLRAFADPQRPDQFRFQPYEQPQLQYFGGQNFGQQFQFQQQPIPYRSQSPEAAATQAVMSLHAEAQQITNPASSGQIDAFLRTLNYAA